mgnify:CR=1 FL=1
MHKEYQERVRQINRLKTVIQFFGKELKKLLFVLLILILQDTNTFDNIYPNIPYFPLNIGNLRADYSFTTSFKKALFNGILLLLLLRLFNTTT